MQPTRTWVTEAQGDYLELSYKIKAVLFSEQSPFQKVEIVDTDFFGKILLNDDLVMLTEKDEFIYHEMLAHVPLFVHPDPKRVLIIGGGDGGTAREVLRHTGVATCRVVEIDPVVVRACRQHLPGLASSFDQPRLALQIEDGVKFMADTAQTFDVILIDSTDPVGPATPLFGLDFYQQVARCLAPNGIVVSQAESPFMFAAMQRKLLEILCQCFEVVSCYNYSNMSYPGGLWSFAFASPQLHPLQDFESDRPAASDLSFRYYSSAMHQAAFTLPPFMRDRLAPFLTI
ncbi:MAG: polyamine aminopropyltransferase [Cyanobacteria bacterium P01_G01_bin.54]